jgi:putative transposase
LAQYEQHGAAGLENRPPGRRRETINPAFELLVLATWDAEKLGSPKLWRLMTAQGFSVSQRRIQAILNQHGRTMNKRRRPHQIKFRTYEWPRPNMLWHTDWTLCPFTGQQLIAFIDDHSRFIVHAEYFANATTNNTLLALQNAISKYGKPEAILTDNGVQFTPARAERGPFTNWCEAQGIRHILGRIHHPQTNGKIERWFGTYKQEFDERFTTLNQFITWYNERRLHQAINYNTPLQRYNSAINAV